MRTSATMPSRFPFGRDAVKRGQHFAEWEARFGGWAIKRRGWIINEWVECAPSKSVAMSLALLLDSAHAVRP